MSSFSSIGARLKNARTKKGYSQKELADLVGVSTAQWSRIESDVNRPSRETLIKTSAYLGVPFHDLVMLAGYSALRSDRSLYSKEGKTIDSDGIVKSLYAVDSDLLEDLKDFEDIGTDQNVKVLTLLLRGMRKEVMESDSADESACAFRKSFRALKDYIIRLYSDAE